MSIFHHQGLQFSAWCVRLQIFQFLHIFLYTENGNKRKRKFFNEWVDAETGKLILAKTNNGKNILGIGDNYNNEDVILNPFLDKFFYIEGLLSNNLRMSLTGSEINHPNKAYNTLYN